MRRGDDQLAGLRRACTVESDRGACEQLLVELYRRGLIDEYLKQLVLLAARYAMDVGSTKQLQTRHRVDWTHWVEREDLDPQQRAWVGMRDRVSAALVEFARVQGYQPRYPEPPGGPSYYWAWNNDVVGMPDMPAPGTPRGAVRIPGRRPVVVIRGPHKGRVDWLTARPHTNARGIGIPPMRNYNDYIRRANLKNIPMQAQTVGFPFVGVYDYQFATLPINVFTFPTDLPIFLPPHPGAEEAPGGFYE